MESAKKKYAEKSVSTFSPKKKCAEKWVSKFCQEKVCGKVGVQVLPSSPAETRHAAALEGSVLAAWDNSFEPPRQPPTSLPD
jgi:hypothetical protein